MHAHKPLESKVSHRSTTRASPLGRRQEPQAGHAGHRCSSRVGVSAGRGGKACPSTPLLGQLLARALCCRRSHREGRSRWRETARVTPLTLSLPHHRPPSCATVPHRLARDGPRPRSLRRDRPHLLRDAWGPRITGAPDARCAAVRRAAAPACHRARWHSERGADARSACRHSYRQIRTCLRVARAPPRPPEPPR